MPLELLTATQVADLFGVAPRTVTRWARTGRLSTIRTLGGHHRFFADEVLRLLEGDGGEPPEAPGKMTTMDGVVLPFPADRSGRSRSGNGS